VTPLLNSNRTFQLWSARAGHGLLLLRSNKSGADDTRIDVLFKPVAALKLRTSLNGLLVREAGLEERAAIEREVGSSGDVEGAFVIESGDFTGYLVASVFASHEDHGDYNSPSYFDGVD
jgi:hypothetical protein